MILYVMYNCSHAALSFTRGKNTSLGTSYTAFQKHSLSSMSLLAINILPICSSKDAVSCKVSSIALCDIDELKQFRNSL